MSESGARARALVARTLISLLLGGLFAWVASRGGLPLWPKVSAFAGLTWWAVPGYVLLLMITHTVRATRWRFLIAPVRKVQLLEAVWLNWIGFFAIFALPLRLGEFVRPALSKARLGVSVSSGLGTVAVERVIDGVVTSLCVVVALFALPHLETTDPVAARLPHYGYLALGIFGSAVVVLLFFSLQPKFAALLVDKTVGLVAPRLGKTLSEKVLSIIDGMRALSSPRLVFGFLLETLLYWGTNALGMWVLARGCGLPLSFGHAVAIMGILAIGILLPTGPGLFGTFQLFIFLALKLYLPEETVLAEGSAYVFLMYGIQAVLITAAGIIPLYALHIPFSALLPGKRESQT